MVYNPTIKCVVSRDYVLPCLFPFPGQILPHFLFSLPISISGRVADRKVVENLICETNRSETPNSDCLMRQILESLSIVARNKVCVCVCDDV